MKVVILGSGTSTGVPQIACQCAVCQSSDAKNKRTRASVYVTDNDQHIIIDPCIDLRIQALRENIHRLDTILVTHTHFDHVGGLDDIRPFNRFKNDAIQIYALDESIKNILNRFDYCFKPPQSGGYLPKFELHRLPAHFILSNLEISSLPYYHGKLPITGFRINQFGYITDCNYLPPETYDLLHNLDVLLINGVTSTPHPTHFSVTQAVEEAQKIKAKKTYLTHISHHIDHETVNKTLPTNIELAYDGLSFEI